MCCLLLLLRLLSTAVLPCTARTALYRSGSFPAGVLCEIVDRDDGSMARTPKLMKFAQQHGLKIITIADLIRYRLRHEQLLQQVAVAPLETRHGSFTAYCFRCVVVPSHSSNGTPCSLVALVAEVRNIQESPLASRVFQPCAGCVADW